jgi:hypothetical protein
VIKVYAGEYSNYPRRRRRFRHTKTRENSKYFPYRYRKF